ncbi:MAG: hypothetical protein HY671_14660 [Chloroflexi bacterium]|nr:hypothetical protein [Chloroflexota bacterium]
MAKDTITLALNGDVELHHFSKALSTLETLVQALTRDLVATEKIRWIIHDLQVSSAIATVRGECDVLQEVERVVDAYVDVGRALERGQPPNFSQSVIRAASGISQLLDDNVPSIRFETADSDITIATQPNITASGATVQSVGAIEGRVQTLSNRKGLRFNLYDTLRDRCVSCYVDEGKEDLLREIWGKRTIVEGEITRDALSGRPLAARRISLIHVLPEIEKGNYLRARGIAPRLHNARRAEEIIRGLRDA